MAMNQPAICADGLHKAFRRRKRIPGVWRRLRTNLSPEAEDVRALRSVSFAIEPGEGVGLIGENGAGKSTLIKLLTGLLVPSGGSVTTLGRLPFRERRRLALEIGVVFGQRPQLLWDLCTADTFELLKAMYQIPEDVYRFTHTAAVDGLDIGGLLHVPVRTLSLGQRMRCDIAASLLHAPRVAFLDEPTIGLDVLGKERVRQHLRELRRRFNMTLVFTTHDFKDITSTCERLIVLEKGSIIYDGELQSFERQFGGERSIVVELSDAIDTEARGQLSSILAELCLEPIWENPKQLLVHVDARDAPRVTAALLQQLPVRDLKLQVPDMDSLVAKLYAPSGQQQR